VEALTEAVFEALPLWLTLLVLLGMTLALTRAALTLMLGEHGAGHVMGTLFVGFFKLLWSVVALPFRALTWLYRRRRLAAVGVVVLIVGGSTACDNARVARGAARGAARKLLGRELGRARAFDLRRDAATPLRRLDSPRTVQRYTSAERAAVEKRLGIPPGSHFTSSAAKGRPLSPQTATKRFGLAKPPEIRETVMLPKGLLVRSNKVVAGEAGFGELTSSERVPGSAIKKTIPLKPGG
jgi:hypothetical protein